MYKVVIGLVLVVVVLVVGYLILSGDSSLAEVEEEERETPNADALSEAAFNYINEYRVANGIEPLNFSYDVYLVALDMSNKKDADKMSFRQAPERNEFIKNSIDLSEFPVQYNSIYEIDGSGLQGFRDEFDRIYFVQNIIKTDKYNVGAIGCNLNYCSLILLNREGAIEVMKDF